jgi:hypothetical protein
MKKHVFILLLVASLISCGGKSASNGTSKPSFPKNSPQQLNEQTISAVLKDMKTYTDAVQKLDQSVLKGLDRDYEGVIFHTEQKPLFLNVYPDAAGGRVIFLMMPKDPATGSNYLLTFGKELPVVNDKTIELQIRTRDPEQPLTCAMKVTDPAAYMSEYQSHDVIASYELTKKYLRSGTYDFDALTVPSYRQHGYAFITFDFHKAEVMDKTANLTATCTD